MRTRINLLALLALAFVVSVAGAWLWARSDAASQYRAERIAAEQAGRLGP